VARYGGPLESNLYAGFLVSNGSSFQGFIYKNIGGAYTLLAAGSFVNTSVGTLEFEAVGPSLKLIFNGQLLAVGEDTSLTTGSVGMRLSMGATVGLFQANPVVASQPTLPFSDDFSTTSPAGPPSDGSQLSRSWTDKTGNVTVVNGQATGVGTLNLSTVNGIKQGDVAVTANVTVLAGQQVGLVARYGGPLESNLYAGFLVSTGSSFQGQIYKNIGGAYTLLASGSFVNTGVGKLEFEAVGPSLKLIFTPQGQTQGTLIAFADDTSLTTGSVGMRIGKGATVGLFQASAVVPAQASLPFSDTFLPTSPAGPPSDGSQLSRSWTDRSGNVTVVGGAAKGTAGSNVSTVNGINVADVTVQATVALNGGAFAGLVARYSGPLESNLYVGS